jgi:hypothetical protein
VILLDAVRLADPASEKALDPELQAPGADQEADCGQRLDSGPASPEPNVTCSMSFFFRRLLGQQEYEEEGGRQGDEAHP